MYGDKGVQALGSRSSQCHVGFRIQSLGPEMISSVIELGACNRVKIPISGVGFRGKLCVGFLAFVRFYTNCSSSSQLFFVEDHYRKAVIEALSEGQCCTHFSIGPPFRPGQLGPRKSKPGVPNSAPTVLRALRITCKGTLCIRLGPRNENAL